MRSPLLAKALAIAGVVLLVSLALARIDALVAERRGRQAEAVRSVERSLAGEQTLIGPLLHRACVEEWDLPLGDGKERSRVATERRETRVTLAPQTLAVQGDAKLEPRQRGLFTVHGYDGKLVLHAIWPALAALQPQRTRADSRLQCGPAILMLAVSDVRGLRAAAVRLDDAPGAIVPGTFHPHYPRGLHVELAGDRLARADAPLNGELTLQLAGTGRLAIVPAAAQTTWSLRSDWPHPSFGGRFLPTTREVGDAGFSAQWQVSALASAAAADVRAGAPPCAAAPEAPDAFVEPQRPTTAPPEAKCLDTLSVAFIDPVNPYVLTDRATKYALLFIALTFGAVMLVEVLTRRRVHPVQYLLVGLALALFFLLLLSLSEHLGFGAAYALAACACVLLLGVYGTAMLGRRRAGLAFGAGMALLYGLLWLLLRLEQTALVVGSTMLFAMLAATMLLTRRIDWFAVFHNLQPRAADGEPKRGEMAVAM